MTRLSEYFTSAAGKWLSAVEADTQRSNQHEFNGTVRLRAALGDQRLDQVPTDFFWLGSDERIVSAKAHLTWYDARDAHPIRTEWRLYFQSNPVMDLASEGCLLLIVKRPDHSLICIVSDDETIQHQLLWLFGLSTASLTGFENSVIDGPDDRSIGFAESWILNALGFDATEEDDLELILRRFPSGFPKTAEFSLLAQDLEGEFNPLNECPDEKLIRFLQREERLFRTLERHLISERLQAGFVARDQVDVEGFISFSLSVQNRRKSRAGHSLENHLEAIFRKTRIEFDRGANTEGKKKPDFLFPGRAAYHDPEFPTDGLKMLGAKSSCKDRWRQVLSEAEKIPRKHLLTLEPGISETQTAEMRGSNLQLIVPRGIFDTYSPNQQRWLLNVSDFIDLVSSNPDPFSVRR
jgi:hypothetical protein